MNVNQDLVTDVIQKVLENLLEEEKSAVAEPLGDGIYQTIGEAVEGAVLAQKRLISMTLAQRDKMIAAIRKAALDNNEKLSAMAIRETKLGRFEDKIKENILCSTKTPGTEDIPSFAKSGDDGLTLLEYAPIGVIGSLTPITNPTGTVIHNSISMIAAGNAVVFNPHPSARETSISLVRLLHQAIVDVGGPAGLISVVNHPTLETAREIMEHPKVNMLVATGGKAVVNAVLRSGKKAIGAGAGNPPVLVDETANIRNAAKSIIDGASINNNIFCTCEKEVIAVDEVADCLIKFMQETGKACLLTPDDAKKVTELVVTREGGINPAFIGKNVQVILKEIGIEVGEECRLAI
ncbi:MAG TPA: aldehyde dehydrogenase family protein, partial [Proteobacteria bacterium]|nr:aldehyde dehydrogenase family protein [Pseudomonadota bacterium]